MRSPSLWFVVPVHGRIRLAKICLRQLRRTCEELRLSGIEASAVLVSDKVTLSQIRPMGLGFAEFERDNQFLSRRFNDGIQFAMDQRFNPRPVHFVVPCGSDDWVDHRLFLELPPPNRIFGFQHMSFVREDGGELIARHLDYTGGCGIRIYPRALMAACGFRPADEDRERGCDTSILRNVQRRVVNVIVEHRPCEPLQIVDWKTRGQQLNSYHVLRRHKASFTETDPFRALVGIFPAEALREMRAHYRLGRSHRPLTPA